MFYLITTGNSTVAVHTAVVVGVSSGSYVFQPFRIVEIPADCLPQPFLKICRGSPTEFTLYLRRVDGIAKIMSLAVGNISDQVERCAFRIAEFCVHSFYESLHEVDVAPFIVAAYVVGLPCLSFMEHEVESLSVIAHKKPVADVLSFTIDRKRTAMTYVCLLYTSPSPRDP